MPSSAARDARSQYKRDGACGVVVAGDDEINTIGRAVGVDHSYDGDAELVGFCNRERFFFHVDDEETRSGSAAHLADTAEGRLQFALLTFHVQALFLGEAFCATFHFLVDRLQAVDGLRNGFPVGQRATEPAVVHVILRALLCGFGDGRCRLALCANKQNAAAFGHGFTDRVQRCVQHGDGLREVHDVDAVALRHR